MKNLTSTFTNVNKLGLLMMALIAFTLMSFKATESEKTTTLYGFDRDLNEWVDLTGLVEGVDYKCEFDSEEEICTAEFDHVPMPNSVPTNETIGVFSIID